MPRNNLPSVTSTDVPRDLRAWIDRVGESLSKLNDAATISELAKAGVITVGPGGNVTGPGGDDDGSVIIPVLTPPAPTGLKVTGGYEYIIVEWDAPEYYGHSYAVVFRNTTADFPTEQAPVIVYGNVYSDYVGNVNVVYDEEGNVTGYETFYYWVAFVNINEVQGPEAGPESAQTAINVDEVIAALTGKLTSTEFVNDLSTFLENAPDNYVVKLGAANVAAGFGLANTGSDVAPEFDFAILADNFFITPPVTFNQDAVPTSISKGQVWRRTGIYPVEYYVSKATNSNEIKPGEWEKIDAAPFIVRTTDTIVTNADGEQTFVPAGVYITDAYIQDGTIARAKIGTAAIDNAKIANAAISSAKVAYLDARNIVTGTLKSPNFTNEAGKAGFLLTMTESGTVFTPLLDANGGFQFNADGTIRGAYDSSYNQEDVTFILRGAYDVFPALQLINGEITISALNIRKQLKSVTWDTDPQTFGFNVDIDAGTVQFRDGEGDNVFEIVDGSSKGLVKMTAAAIRDTFKSHLYGNDASGSNRSGFYLNTGLAYDGETSSPQFYLRGANGKILFAVDGSTETLAEEIKNSNVTTSNLAGSVNQNPLMTDINFKTNLPRPRNYFVASTTLSDTLSYVDDAFSIARLRQPKSVSSLTTDKIVALCTSAIRVDDSVKRYKILIRWKANKADGYPGGLSFWCTGTTEDTLDEGKVALTHYAGLENEPEVQFAGLFLTNVANVTVLSDSNMIVTTDYADTTSGSTPYNYVLRDDVRDENGDLYPDYQFSSVYNYFERVIQNATWNTTELLVTPQNGNNRFKWMSFNINLGLQCSDDLELEIDQIVISPYELKGDKILDDNGDRLGLFAWVQDKITSGNITTYLENAAIVDAVIGNAEVKTLKIDDEATMVPRYADVVTTGSITVTTTPVNIASITLDVGPTGTDVRLLIIAHVSCYPSTSTAATLEAQIVIDNETPPSGTAGQTIANDGNTISVTASKLVPSGWNGTVYLKLKTSSPGASSKALSGIDGGLIVMAAKR